MSGKFNIAAAQLAPVYLNLDASIDKAIQWIADAGRQEVRILVFPETWLPGYPIWLDIAPEAALWDHAPVKQLFQKLYENSPEVDSDAVRKLCKAAKKAKVNVVMGLNERAGTTLYNSMLYISEEGEILGLHRKLIPTYSERMIWGRGDGSTLTAVDTAVGRLGGLVCWEHWMPLARQAMHNQQELVHAAVWPSVKETHTLASRTYAFEGRCFVAAAGSVLTKADLPENLPLFDSLPDDGPFMTGGSMIISPTAEVLAGPVLNDEALLIAEIDPVVAVQEKMTLDVSGHYARPDVFRFEVNDSAEG